jgi:hypothetical protein
MHLQVLRAVLNDLTAPQHLTPLLCCFSRQNTPLSCKQLPLHKLPAAAPSELYPYILQHGRGILSLSTLQQGLQHFLVPGIGYIAYTTMRNGPDVFNILSPLALGDPICDPANFKLMAEAFLQQHPKAIFMQVRFKQR